jgi:hypothetical protein
MRLAALSLILMLAGCATKPVEVLADFDNRGTIANPENTLAFIGEKVEVAHLIDTGPEDPSVIVLDLAYAARYRVLQVVHGEYDKPTIDFVAFDHYGFPKFAKRDIALIYVSEHEGALYHRKYQFDEVFPTADGRYAGCGDPYVDPNGDPNDQPEVDRRPLEKIEFKPPVRIRISQQYIPRDRRGDYSREEIAENKRKIDAYYAPPAFDVRGDIATCRMGVYADELFRIRNETTFLPARRENLCYDTLKLDQSKFYSQDSSEQLALDACVADLKGRGLP